MINGTLTSDAPVISGGGIDPDIKVEDAKVTRIQNQIGNTGLFMFVRELIGGQVAAAPTFKLGAIEFNHPLKPNEFAVTDEIMKAYRAFMADFMKARPEWGITQAMVDENMEWAREQIREEVLTQLMVPPPSNGGRQPGQGNCNAR